MKKTVIYSVIAIIFGIGFYALSRNNYLLFHLLVENIAVVVGVLIFTISLISRRFQQNSFIELLGPGVLISSLVTFLHIATYKGMNIIVGYDANLPTQLWVISNYILSLTVLVAVWRMNKNTNYTLLIAVYASLGTVGTVLSFLRIFPDCFIEGSGLTLFKQLSEYVVIAVYFCAAILLFRHKKRRNDTQLNKTALWMALFILANMMFTFYIDVYGVTNFLGHYLRVVAFCLVFSAVVMENVQKPLTTIFGQLNLLSITDSLTQLFNHRFFIEGLEKYQELALKEGKPLYLIMLDVDHFKDINDQYGHPVGDAVLQETAKLLNDCIRSTDFAFRQGGDEFAVILYDTKEKEVRAILERIKGAFGQVRLTDKRIQIALSGGVAKYAGESVDAFIETADTLLYKAKNNGRNMVQLNF